MSASVGLGCSPTSQVTSVSSRWISPYTYQGLLGATVGGPGGALLFSGRHVMTLFLGLTIGRDRKVVRRFSFHYEAPRQGGTGCESPFSYEFLDEKRQVLDCGLLHCRCTGGNCQCWPKVLRDAIPKPHNARWFVVWEGDKQIYEEKIPDPPQVRIVAAVSQAEGSQLTWYSTPADGLWYLVHWRDTRHGVFRGVAPRLQKKSLLVPKRLFASGPELRVRVYATSGIATGYADTTLKLDYPEPPGPGLTLLGGQHAAKGPQPISCVLSVIAMDSAGRQVGADHISWFTGGGNQLARGSHLDLRSLPIGTHVVRAVARGLGGALIGKSWLVERTAERCLMHHVICDPPPKRTHEEHQHPHPAPPPCEG